MGIKENEPLITHIIDPICVLEREGERGRERERGEKEKRENPQSPLP